MNQVPSLTILVGECQATDAAPVQCTDLADNGTRSLFEDILVDEERHVDWLEAQLELIRQIGIQNYLAQQMDPEEG